MRALLSDPIEGYLTDHLAGAHGALKLIDGLRRRARDTELGALMTQLRVEIAHDREDLVAAMDRLGVRPGRVKPMLAVAAGSVARLGFPQLGKPESLATLVALEALSAGIWTKGRLWRALAANPQTRNVVGEAELQRLIARAQDQWERLEPHHAEAAERCLSDPSVTDPGD